MLDDGKSGDCGETGDGVLKGGDVYALNSARTERIGGIKWAEDVVTFSDSYEEMCNQIIDAISLHSRHSLLQLSPPSSLR